MCVLWFNTQCLPTLTLHLIKYIIFWRTGDISEKTAHMKHAEGAAAPLVSWINQLCLLSMKSNVLVANAPTMLSASQLTWFFFIEIKGMGCLCVCALPIINYFSTPSFWIFLICPWEKPRKLQFYTALFYYLLVFSLNDRRGSVPNDESLGLEYSGFKPHSDQKLEMSWIVVMLLASSASLFCEFLFSSSSSSFSWTGPRESSVFICSKPYSDG